MVPFLETERLYLYKVTEEFCSEEYLSWLHDQEVNNFLVTGLYPQSIDDLITYVNNIPKNAIFLAIVVKESKKHIGNIKIEGINYRDGRGEYGIMMGDKNEWGKGYAKEASIVIVNHCFQKLNLRKITLGVIEENKNAVNLYKKLGFEIEGVLKKHSYYDGNYRNTILMAIFNTNFK